MRDYIIYTDSSCDLDYAILNSLGIVRVEMSVRFDNEDNDFSQCEESFPEFYKKMKGGQVAKTSAINPNAFVEAFENTLKKGEDILYLCFASELSTTYNNALIAREELSEAYPESRIEIIDTASASIGLGLIVYLAGQMKKEGKEIHDVKEYVEKIARKVCHCFSVDDLNYLKRGGRISATTAFVGNALGIKPIINIDDAGKLLSTDKARGKTGVINNLLKQYEEKAVDKGGTIIIGHADNLESADLLKKNICEKYNCKTAIITQMGPIICAHTGPGTLGLVFLGSSR